MKTIPLTKGYVAAVDDEDWYAMLRTHKVGKFLGLFTDPKDAARAYDSAALIAFGEFVKTNRDLGLLASA